MASVDKKIAKKTRISKNANVQKNTKITAKPSPAQKRYLKYGLKQPGGKLPLFDKDGQRIPAATIRACMQSGWCEPWAQNPIEPKWLVCKLTNGGLKVAKS